MLISEFGILANPCLTLGTLIASRDYPLQDKQGSIRNILHLKASLVALSEHRKGWWREQRGEDGLGGRLGPLDFGSRTVLATLRHNLNGQQKNQQKLGGTYTHGCKRLKHTLRQDDCSRVAKAYKTQSPFSEMHTFLHAWLCKSCFEGILHSGSALSSLLKRF